MFGLLGLMLAVGGDADDAAASLALARAARERPAATVTQFVPRAMPAPPPAAIIPFGGWGVVSPLAAGAPAWCGPRG